MEIKSDPLSLLSTIAFELFHLLSLSYQSIKEEIEAIGGREAADLAVMILQPSQMKRAQTFAEILEHDYFTNHSTD